MHVGFFPWLRSPISTLFFVLMLAGVASASEERTWTDLTGKFTVTAELVQVQDGLLILRRADGQEVKVPLEKISAADRKFVDSKAAAHAPADKPTEVVLAKIATRFYSDLRTADRSVARQSLTKNAESLMTTGQSPLAGLPQPQPGSAAIKIGKAECNGDVAEIPVMVRAGGSLHKTKLHLR